MAVELAPAPITEPTQPADSSLIGRVRRGAFRCDEFVPDWFERVDPLTLDIKMSCDCICGQLGGGDFGKGVEALGLAANLQDYGLFWGDDRNEYPLLTALWRDEINARRQRAAA